MRMADSRYRCSRSIPVLSEPHGSSGEEFMLMRTSGAAANSVLNGHLSAIKQNRQKVNNDMIAVSEELIKRKVTSPSHLEFKAAATADCSSELFLPKGRDLYNAVVCQVPLLDMNAIINCLPGPVGRASTATRTIRKIGVT